MDKRKARGTARLKTETGFTLVELMVVVGIMSFLVMLAVPNFLDWNRKYQLKDGVGQLHGNLGMARMSAINQNTIVTVTVCNKNVSCALPSPATGVAPHTPTQVTAFFKSAAGTDVVPPLLMNQGVSLTDASGANITALQDVRFNSMGLKVNTGNGICSASPCSPTAAQYINFKNARSTPDNYRIVIQPTGKVSWCYSASCTN